MAAHKLMKFISDLTEYFRIRVDLESSRPQPLVDIDLLGACWIINRFHFADYDLPTKGLFMFRDYGTTLEVIPLARQNPELLKSVLLRLKQAASRHSSSFFEALTDVERYLNELEALKK